MDLSTLMKYQFHFLSITFQWTVVGRTGVPGVPVLSRVVEEAKQDLVLVPILRRQMVEGRALGLSQKLNTVAQRLVLVSN